MKKFFIMAAAAAFMLSCGGNKTDDKASTEKAEAASNKANAAANNNAPIRVAFVEVDSLMTQYQFCKDYSDVLAQEYANIQKELASKQRSLEEHAASVQRKYESAGYTTREELERAQAGVAREQQSLAELSDRLGADFANRQADYNKEMRDSIQAFLADYNKDKKFDYILSKGGDNMLYANPAFDITDDVINGLNKRYKAKPEIAEKLTTDEKK